MSKPQLFKTWLVYLIQADCGFAYVGQTHDLKKRLKRHRTGKVKTTAKVNNPQSYRVLRLWACPGYFVSLEAELKVQRFLRNFGTQSTLNWKATSVELARDTTRFHSHLSYALKCGLTAEECYRTVFPEHPLGAKFDPELDQICF